MHCPYCKKGSRVLESRESESSLRRRRECRSCRRRFTTYERVEATNILVVKRSGERQQFSREKIKRGILQACRKRPISQERVERLLDKIEERVKKTKGEIASEKIGRIVLSQLKRLDKIAYIRFASVYLDFADPEDFHEVLEQIARRKKK